VDAYNPAVSSTRLGMQIDRIGTSFFSTLSRNTSTCNSYFSQLRIARPDGKITHTQESDAAKCEETMKSLVIGVLVTFSSLSVSAQTPQAPAPSGEAWSPAKSIGMYAYARNQQNADQQLKDESQCYGSARQQTGVDPQTSAPATPSPEQQKAAQQQAAQQGGQSVPKGGTVRGSAGGAAGGAAIGAAAGDAGKGAAIGATTGAVVGRRRQKRAKAEAQKQASQETAQSQQKAQAEASAQHQASLDSFKKAFSACMDARGYSIR
jgi:hypothetical protein